LTGHSQVGGMFEDDRAKLAAELDAAKSRERDLAQAGEQASQALGRAIAEIRAALAQTAEAEAAEPEKGAA
jgi:septal ring factor EnvC (AmiA/AmiB activator)